MKLTLLATTILFAAASASAATKAEDILDGIDDLYRGDSSSGKMTMTVQTENWNRTLQMEFWSKGEEKSLIKILSPKKEKGTATLRVDKNIWNYLPKVKRTIKVPSSMMGGSWMGSHFTNNDLVRESRMADDFNYEITFEGERDGQKIVELTLIPKPDVPVVWGKIVAEVSANHLPVRLRYYDEDEQLARTMIYSDITTVDGRKLPSKMRIVPADDPEEYTEMHFKDWTYDTNVPDSTFSLRALQR